MSHNHKNEIYLKKYNFKNQINNRAEFCTYMIDKKDTNANYYNINCTWIYG